jgi:hypothetical protein
MNDNEVPIGNRASSACRTTDVRVWAHREFQDAAIGDLESFLEYCCSSIRLCANKSGALGMQGFRSNL